MSSKYSEVFGHLTAVSESLNARGYRCRFVTWGLGPSIAVSRNAGIAVEGVHTVPDSVFIAPDGQGWCVIDDGGETVFSGIDLLADAVRIALERLDSRTVS